MSTPSIKVQRGITDVWNTGRVLGGSDGLETVDPSKTFEKNLNNQRSHAGSITSSGNMEGDDMGGTIELTGPLGLTFDRIATSLAQDMRFSWELWEYVGPDAGPNEFLVRHRETAVMATAAGVTVTLDNAPTDRNRCIPFITGVTTTVTSNGEDHLTCTAYINDSGELVIERGGGDGAGTTTVQVVVVEFTGSNWSVGHGRVTGQNGDTGTITLNTDSDGAGGSTFNVPSWAQAAIFGDHRVSSNHEGLAHQAVRYLDGAATSEVDWAFNSGHAATGDHVVHVLAHPDMNVTRYAPGESAALYTNIDISSAGLTSLEQSAIDGHCQTSGTGDALGRGWRNYDIETLTNARHWCHRSGNTMVHEVQVIDLVGITDAAGPAGDTVQIHDGTQLVAADVLVYDGSQLVAATAELAP